MNSTRPAAVRCVFAALVAVVGLGGVAAAQSWPVPGGDAGRSRVAHGVAGLKAPTVRWRRGFADRPAEQAVLAADLDGDGTLELLAARGGRVDTFTPRGQLAWSSPPLGAERLGGVFDFDGDGRLEVLVVSPQVVRLLDARTGRARWSSAPGWYERVGAVVVHDADGDRLPDLFVAEASCSQSARGPADVYGFAGGFEGDRLRAQIDEPREYTCGLWHTFGDLDGDGRDEVVVPDQRAVHAFDPRTGARVLEGEPFGDLPFGIAPHRTLDVLPDSPGAEVLALFDYAFGEAVHREIVLLDAVDGRLRPIWRVPVPPLGALDTPRVVVAEGAVFASVFVPDAGWSIRVHDAATGEIRGEIADARLLARLDLDGDGTAELVTASGDARLPGPFGRLVVRDAGGAERWRLDAAQILSRSVGPAESFSTADQQVPSILEGSLVVLRDNDGDEQADVVERLDAAGAPIAAYPVGATPGFVPTVGGEAALVLALADGELGLFDARLRPLNDADGDGLPDVAAPSGLGRVVAADIVGDAAADPVVLTAAGRLAVLDAEGRPVWQLRMRAGGDHPQAGQLVPGGGREIIAPDGRAPGQIGWAAIDGAGRPLWHHRLPLETHRNVGTPVLVDVDGDGAEDLVRVDQRRADEALVMTALSGPDGRVLWSRTWPRVGMGSLGRPTVVAFPPEPARLIFPESDVIRVFDLVDGAELRQARTARFGGRLQPTGSMPPYLRVGANGPLEALDAGLGVVWTAPDEGPARGWLQQAAVVVGGAELWAVTGAGQPLARYALATGEVLGRTALLDGEVVALPAERLADVGFVSAVDDLFGQGTPGGLVTASDGHLYAFAPGAVLRWALPFYAGLGDPAIADLDGDGELELLVPAGDGSVARIDKPGADAPAEVWDNDGESLAGRAARDVDEIRRSDRFGADWPAVDLVDGYEARVAGPGGAAVTPWIEVLEPSVVFAGLSLTPGLSYNVEVRAWRVEGAQRARSAVTRSDGVRVVDEGAPEVRVEAAPDPFFPDDGPLDVRVVASDADRVAALSLTIVDAAGGDVATVFQGPVAAPNVDQTWQWAGRGFDGLPLPTGRYAVVAAVVDRADRAASARDEFVLCGAGGGEAACGVDAGADAAPVAPDLGPRADGGPDAGSDGGPDVGPDAGDEERPVTGDACECNGTGPGGLPLVGLLALGSPALRRRRR